MREQKSTEIDKIEQQIREIEKKLDSAVEKIQKRIDNAFSITCGVMVLSMILMTFFKIF